MQRAPDLIGQARATAAEAAQLRMDVEKGRLEQRAALEKAREEQRKRHEENMRQ